MRGYTTGGNPAAGDGHRHDSASVVSSRGRQDVEAATAVLLRAFANQENARLGPRYIHSLLMTFHTEPRRVLLVSQVQDRIVGFGAGEPASCETERYRSLKPAAALALISRPWLLLSPSIIRMAIARLNADAKHRVPAESWFLAILGVDPKFAGLGVGHHLLAAFEEEGRRRGFRTAALLVRDSNHAARSLYDSSGWQTDERCLDGRILYTKEIARE